MNSQPSPDERPGPRTPLSGGVFLWSTLFAVFFYFYFEPSPITPYIPAVVPGAILVQAAWAALRCNVLVAFNPAGIHLLFAYVLIGTLSLIFTQTFDFYTARKLLLPGAILIVSAFLYQVEIGKLQLFFLTLFVLSLLLTAISAGEAGSISTNPFSTHSATESVFGLALGAGAVWMISAGRNGWALMLLVGCIILFKRNAIAASLLCIMFYLCLSAVTKPSLRKAIVQSVSLATVLALFVFSFYLNDVFDHISGSLSGVTPGHVSTGRSYIYRAILHAMSNGSIEQWLIGHGPGAVERLIASTSYIDATKISLPHNEYLSLLYDYGLFGAAVLLYYLHRLSHVSVGAALVVLYMFLMIIIENLFFISFVFMIMLFLVSVAPGSKNKFHFDRDGKRLPAT